MLVDFSNPYLTTQLIAYLGNKRRLLSRLSAAFDELEEIADIRSFIDPFAGSGSVSRLAKVRGYRVFANDWEPFAYVVNAAHVAIDATRARSLFPNDGGLSSVFADLHAGSSTQSVDGVFCRLYAPEATDSADPNKERLFYTRENAEYLDRIRSEIETRYPGWDLEPEPYQEKILLLASLVYEAATHANTSGVFKAYYKRFGGYGADALGRILSPMKIEEPELISGAQCIAACEDAAVFTQRITADLCYLDPPYNQHQYGSNYHILNTVVLGDEPPLSDPQAKAGIRSDWSKTWSPYCSRRTAGEAFKELFATIDARFIVLSYNTEGTCNLDELFDMMSSQGAVRILNGSYVKYRGGKQSIARINHNQELLFLLDRRRKLGASSKSELRRSIDERDVYALLRQPLHPERVRDAFEIENSDVLLVETDSVRVAISIPELPIRRTFVELPDLASLEGDELTELKAKLHSCSIIDRSEEVELLRTSLAAGLSDEMTNRAAKQLLNSLKKFAYQKYRREFEDAVTTVTAAADEAPQRFPGIASGIAEIAEIASARFSR